MKRHMMILALLIGLASSSPAFAGDELTCWFPPNWAGKAAQAEAISATLSANSGLTIRAKIAGSYPQILAAFTAPGQNLVYGGSFVQSIIVARKLGKPLVQNKNGQEMYSGILIYPAGQDPLVILKDNPSEIAFAIGASSGESSAKAATMGQAAVGVANHADAIAAVQSGEARAAVVKNWWWASRAAQFPELSSFEIPGVSLARNPDNVLTVSREIANEVAERIQVAAMASREAFGSNAVITPFRASDISFSLGLMQQGRIDPLTYSWTASTE